MSQTQELTGRWVATVQGRIVAEGTTLEEVAEKARAQYGEDEFVVEKVVEPGIFIL